jgi:hypothetical protein
VTVPPQSASDRRRRIVFTIAVLVVGVAWWSWPRGDARFVGKWHQFEGDNTLPETVVNFRRSGIADMHYLPTNEHFATTWAVVDGNLVLGLESDRWWFGIVDSVTNKWNAAFGTNYWWFGGSSLPIRATSQDELRLGPPAANIGAAGSPGRIYRRIPQ